jgi:acetolactate synthase-1/2/3 large subunit
MKYSDQIAEWLVNLGYTHFFFVSGGNIMHLLNSFSKKLIPIPVIHEVAAGIAAEYFNETSDNNKAFALVTAGPGVTNILTAIAGAYLESRDLLVIGGQVKTADLSRGKLRQRGIQEIDGIALVKSITKTAFLMDRVVNFKKFCSLFAKNNSERPGPIFIEIPLDIQARITNFPITNINTFPCAAMKKVSKVNISMVAKKIFSSKRPVILIGGGVSRSVALKFKDKLELINIPIMTTWNGADRISADQKNYRGRPNTWGQRSANLIIQQSDLVIAIGTRLSLQQTGFNWKSFVPNGKIIHIDIDKKELQKKHPKTTLTLEGDANHFLINLLKCKLGNHIEWINYSALIRNLIPLVEDVNKTRKNFLSPYSFVSTLSKITNSSDIIIPCSSGSAFTVMMQTYEQKYKQKIVTNKGLASMGYGLSGAIGAAIANPKKRIILVEGDGGFAQNLQEIGTASINKLNIKIFIFDDSGYASIRATQKNYFGGKYIGCDRKTGLGIPDWKKLFSVWGINAFIIKKLTLTDKTFKTNFSKKGTVAFIIKIDPEQTYFPKITSFVTKNGSMQSKPLHKMSPDLPENIYKKVSRYL